MKLDLYIGGTRADLGDSGSEALILWTYTREDLDDPSAVKNSYTKTVTLPGSDTNLGIFGSLGRPDRHWAAGMYDPLQRYAFEVFDERGACIESGYIKVNHRQMAGDIVCSYDVTLYGGVGGLIYALMYDDAGDKLNLNSIEWPDWQGAASVKPAAWFDSRDVDFYLGDAWTGSADNVYQVFQFVPALNGIPSGDFDAGKAYYQPGASPGQSRLAGVPTSVTEDGVTYGIYPGLSGVILSLGDKFTEWETQNFNPWQQRVAVHVKDLLLACVHYTEERGAWRLVLDNSIAAWNDPDFWATWIVLPDPDDPSGSQDLWSWLRGTASPADYLLGIAKQFGLIFLPDPGAKTVTLMTRAAFFNDPTPVDISGRVDASAAKAVPHAMAARIYDFELKTFGAYADSYATRFGRTYGSFRLDTGYRFDADTITIPGDTILRGAADVRESSSFAYVLANDINAFGCKFTRYYDVKYNLYNGTATKSVTATAEGSPTQYTLPALPQFHDAAGRRTDAHGVLLYKVGTLTLPTGGTVAPARWYIGTAPWTACNALNGGKSCWNISPGPGVTQVSELPYFRRWWLPDGAASCNQHLDFGDPAVVAVPEHLNPNGSVYDRWWDHYLADRYDRNTLTVTIRMDLSGMQVSARTLRRFYWWAGAVWVINKIIDYNPAGDSLATVELIRVNDMQNYG